MGIRVVRNQAKGRGTFYPYKAIYEDANQSLSVEGISPEDAKQRLHKHMAQQVVRELRRRHILNPSPSRRQGFVVMMPWEGSVAYFGDTRFSREGGVARKLSDARRYSEAKAKKLAKHLGGWVKKVK